MLTVRTEEQVLLTPKVYQADDAHFFLTWIAEGTDGALYSVPCEPGGWKHRTAFLGNRDTLTPVSAQKARAISHFVGGDDTGMGTITVARTHEPQPQSFAHSSSAGSSAG